jgi:hypothetical protein
LAKQNKNKAARKAASFLFVGYMQYLSASKPR